MTKKNLKNTLTTIVIIFIITLSTDSLFLFAEAGNPDTLPNPIRAVTSDGDPRLIIGNIIRAIISVSGALALIMFVYGGLLFMTAGGNETQIKKGQRVLVYSILGIIVIAAAFVATNTIIQAILTGSVIIENVE